MTESKKKTTTKKTTIKKDVVKKEVNPMDEMLKNMTPEMMQQFMSFMQQQNSPKVVVEEKPKITKSYLSKIRDREVVVRSVSMGVVGFESKKTNVYYSWMNYGDTEIISVGEILEMESRSKLFLHTPWLVIEDDEVNEALGLSDTKKSLDVFDDFESFLELSLPEIKDYLSKVEKGYLHNICGKIQQAIDDGILTDFRKIRDLEKMVKAEFKY